LTRVKRLQVILSTHSPYVLSELPRDARILLARTTDGIEIVYGPSVELCLSEIDDKLYSELDIMVEDNESKVIVTELVRNYAPEIHQKIRIIPVGPYNVVDTLDRLDKEEKIPYNLLGIIDGDQEAKSAIKLPGKFAPEKQIIQDVSSKSVDKLAQVMILNRSLVEKEIIEVQTVIDYHEWLARLGDRFNVSPIILWNNLVSVWVKDCLPRDEALKLTDAIKDRLSRHRTAR
jgi:hypothetical protein